MRTTICHSGSPDDETAKERHNAYGKTEMWYIVDAEKDSSLVLGFNHEIDKATYLQALHRTNSWIY